MGGRPGEKIRSLIFVATRSIALNSAGVAGGVSVVIAAAAPTLVDTVSF
jgi:hypothetical protein